MRMEGGQIIVKIIQNIPYSGLRFSGIPQFVKLIFVHFCLMHMLYFTTSITIPLACREFSDE